MTDSGSVTRSRLHLGCIGLILAIALTTAFVTRRQGREITRQELAIKHVENLGGRADRLSVDLSYTKARGDDLQILQPLTALKRLDVGHANLTSGDGIHLQALSHLEFLLLAGSNLSDGDLAALSDFSRLRSLSLRDVPITDAGLVHLASLTVLETLDLAGTHIHAAGLSALRSLPNLKSLTLSEHCITSHTLTTLSSLGSLQYVFLDVPAGNGRQARDLLATLDGVTVKGIMRSSSAVLWTASAPWDTTTAGVAELVASVAELEDHEATELLHVLARLNSSGNWPRPCTAPRVDPFASEIADSEPTSISSIEEFIEQLRISESWWDDRLRQYARENVTPADVPKLLETVRNKQWQHQRYGFLRLVVPLLVQHGLDCEETEHVLRELLSDEPGTVSPPSPLARLHPTDIPRIIALDLNPYFDDPWHLGEPKWTMTTDEARVAFRLLSPYAGSDVPYQHSVDDEFGGIVNAALGGIANLDLADEIMELLVNRVASSSARNHAVGAVKRVAHVAPAAALNALPKLNDILGHPDPAVRASALEAIGYAAAADDRAAQAAANTCLDLLSEANTVSKSAGIALGQLVAGNNPQARKQIVRRLLTVSNVDARESNQAAPDALKIVVTTIRDRTNWSHGSPTSSAGLRISF